MRQFATFFTLFRKAIRIRQNKTCTWSCALKMNQITRTVSYFRVSNFLFESFEYTRYIKLLGFFFSCKFEVPFSQMYDFTVAQNTQVFFT